MVRQRKIPALVSAAALLAGCGSSGRAEVSGTVRDALTGRVIAGARLVSADGVATRTDESGHFTLLVPRGVRRSIRASAPGHEDRALDVRGSMLDAGELDVALAPTALLDARSATELAQLDRAPLFAPVGGETDAVVRWVEETWVTSARRALDAGMPLGVEVDAGVPLDASCVGCHDSSLAASLGLGELQALAGGSAHWWPVSDVMVRDPSCGACHGVDARGIEQGTDVMTGQPLFALHGYERAGEHDALGTGAVCARCHDGSVAGAEWAAEEEWGVSALHATDVDVLRGTGAALGAVEEEGGPHAWVADACVACHVAPRAGVLSGASDHLRAIDDATCARCHGGDRPWRAPRDRDGDGLAGTLAEELDRALARAWRDVSRAIAERDVRDRCGARARGVVDVQGVAWLSDGARLLGDCDASGAIDGSETGVRASELPVELAARVHDVMLVARDRSGGVHNPSFLFRTLQVASQSASTGRAVSASRALH